MAGAGTNLWVTGDVITANQFNTYLQDQVIAVFADTSARDAAFGGAGEPTLAEGMACFVKDINELQIYSGSAWISVLDIDLFDTSKIELNKDSGSASIKLTTAHDTEATTPFVSFRKADGTVASPALVDDDAVLGTLSFQGYAGNSYATGARIKAVVDGTPAADLPGHTRRRVGNADHGSNDSTQRRVKVHSGPRYDRFHKCRPRYRLLI